MLLTAAGTKSVAEYGMYRQRGAHSVQDSPDKTRRPSDISSFKGLFLRFSLKTTFVLLKERNNRN